MRGDKKVLAIVLWVQGVADTKIVEKNYSCHSFLPFTSLPIFSAWLALLNRVNGQNYVPKMAFHYLSITTLILMTPQSVDNSI